MNASLTQGQRCATSALLPRILNLLTDGLDCFTGTFCGLRGCSNGGVGRIFRRLSDFVDPRLHILRVISHVHRPKRLVVGQRSHWLQMVCQNPVVRKQMRLDNSDGFETVEHDSELFEK